MSVAAGEVLYAGLRLLDRQLVDRDGRLCGKVDDLELTVDSGTGTAFVSAILTGPGALLQRTGHVRLGGWLRRFGEGRLDRIPIGRVADIDDHVTLSLGADSLATAGGEQWVRDHVTDHIPGSGGSGADAGR